MHQLRFVNRLVGRRLISNSATATAPTTIKRNSVVDLTLLGIVGAGLSGFMLYARGNRKEAEEGKRAGVFTVPVVNQTGAQTTKTLSLLSSAEVNTRLKEHEASYSVSRVKNPIFRYDTSQLASNSPIEDDSCCVILERERDPANQIQGDLMFYGVFDGHSGWNTSRRVANSLVNYVAKELDLVYRGKSPYVEMSVEKVENPKWSLFSSSKPTSITPLDLQDHIVQAAIKNAFDKLDEDIVQGPIRLLLSQESSNLSRPKEGMMSAVQTENLHSLLSALSGSCALLAFFDIGRNKLSVACTGDSRAIMGTWDGKGKWKVESLSQDQTGKNFDEVKRIQLEHPGEEETVIARGRVLGGLEPSRAFGDSRYKWELGMAARLAAAFHPGSIRGEPKSKKTPPYVTATPEVVTIDLSKGLAPAPKATLSSFLPISHSTESPTPRAQRFIVLATDGLYDQLENEEIVALVGAHLEGIRSVQSRKSLLSHISESTPNGVNVGHTHSPRQQPERGEPDPFIFEDGNLGTHLIRNALGGAKREQVSAMLSIPAPLSRRYRDDITVTVILLGDVAPGGSGEVGAGGGVSRRDDTGPLRSKL